MRESANHAGAHETFAPMEGEEALLPPPAAPGQLQAEVGDAQITLYWTKAARAIRYNVWRSTDGETYDLIATDLTEQTYTDSSLTNGQTYFYKVVGVDERDRIGEASTAIPATPVALGDPIQVIASEDS